MNENYHGDEQELEQLWRDIQEQKALQKADEEQS